jgi:KDO2-lipid IV(A) lauroyltransferase
VKNAPALHAVEYGLFRLLSRSLRLLPHEAARALGGGFGDLAWLVLGSRRRVALGNLALAMPEIPRAQRRRVARRSFRHLGRMFCDTISSHRFDSVEICRRLTLQGWEHLEAARARGRGVLVMSAHLGSWEMAAHTVGLYGEPMHVIGRPLDNPRLDRVLCWQRQRFGNATLPKKGAARGALRVLRDAGVVGILIDQRVRPAQGIRVPFFGHPAVTSPLLGRLALRTGAPVVPLYGTLMPRGRYRVAFHPPVALPEEDTTTSGGSAAEDPVAELTRLCLEHVEQTIRAGPDQWMWLHRRWKG